MGHPAGVAMTTYDGAAFGPASGDEAGTWTGASVDGAALAVQGGADPAYPRGGSTALDLAAWPRVGTFDGQGPTAQASALATCSTASVGRLNATGAVLVGRCIAVSAVYRSGDRLTLAGYARDVAGQPLRAMQIQFIGESVQSHYFGSATDLDGVYVAFLEQGDTYTAFAFSPATGIMFRLERREDLPNQTNLTFRQLTKRGGYGEGIYLQGA
jgi:hypothetical protein